MASFVNGDSDHVTKTEMDSFLHSFDDENEDDIRHENGYQTFPSKTNLRLSKNIRLPSSLNKRFSDRLEISTNQIINKSEELIGYISDDEF